MSLKYQIMSADIRTRAGGEKESGENGIAIATSRGYRAAKRHAVINGCLSSRRKFTEIRINTSHV